MTDTPRTLEQLLVDFEDQLERGITPQKMRNLIVSTGLVFEARLLSAKSIADNAPPTRVAFDSIVYDPYEFWDGSWPIVPEGLDGTYLIACSFGWAANSVGSRVLDIGTDSPDDLDGAQWVMPAAAAPYTTAQTGSWVSKGNEVGFGFYTQVTQNSGGPLNLNYCTLTLSRILP
jgi:hypothetical protein